MKRRNNPPVTVEKKFVKFGIINFLKYANFDRAKKISFLLKNENFFYKFLKNKFLRYPYISHLKLFLYN